MDNNLIPQIPSYLVAIAAILLGVEYAGRYCRSATRNYAFLGKALMRFYFAAAILAMYLDGLPLVFRHNLTRYGMFALLAFDLLYVIIEHLQQIKGDERRNDWLRLCRRNRKKVTPK